MSSIYPLSLCLGKQRRNSEARIALITLSSVKKKTSLRINVEQTVCLHESRRYLCIQIQNSSHIRITKVDRNLIHNISSCVSVGHILCFVFFKYVSGYRLLNKPTIFVFDFHGKIIYIPAAPLPSHKTLQEEHPT